MAALAAMLDATIGEEPADPSTHPAPGSTRPRFKDALRPDSLKDARVGVLEPLLGNAADDQDVIRVVRASIEELKKEGATTVAVPMPDVQTD